MAKTQLDYTTLVTTIRGEDTDLTPYKGKVLLILNTASKCGYTPQFKGLETLHETLSPRGLQILGFPCNQFGAQEPGDGEQIASFCQLNYGVTFPMHAKIDVNGSDAHPLFAQLKAAAPGLLGSKSIKWNFTKFLVDREGTIVRRYGPKTTPEEITSDIEALL